MKILNLVNEKIDYEFQYSDDADPNICTNSKIKSVCISPIKKDLSTRSTSKY